MCCSACLLAPSSVRNSHESIASLDCAFSPQPLCFLQPLPAPSDVCCTARLLSIEGRKVWSAVELTDRPGGTVFASGKVREPIMLKLCGCYLCTASCVTLLTISSAARSASWKVGRSARRHRQGRIPLSRLVVLVFQHACCSSLLRSPQMLIRDVVPDHPVHCCAGAVCDAEAAASWSLRHPAG